jgi:hypothetical protein
MDIQNICLVINRYNLFSYSKISRYFTIVDVYVDLIFISEYIH